MRRLTGVALGLLAFSIPWEEAISLGSLGTLARVFALLAVCTGVACVFGSAMPFRKPDPILGLAWAFLCWSAASGAWSLDAPQTLTRTATLLRVMGMCWLIWQFSQTKGEQKRLVQSFLVGCGITACAVLANFRLGIGDTAEGRYTAANMNENGLAMTFAFGIVLAVQLTRSDTAGLTRRWWLVLIYCCVLGAAALLTGSRGGMLVLLCGIGSLWIGTTRRGLASVVVFAAVLVAAYYGSSKILPEATARRLGGTGRELLSGSWSDRRVINAWAVEIFLDNPVVGVGAGAFSAAIQLRSGIVADPHNTFTGVAAETGVVGFLLFFSIPTTLLMRARRMRPVPRLTWTTVLVMWLVVGLSTTWDYSKMTWLLFGLCAAESRQRHESGKKRVSAALRPSLSRVPQKDAWVT